MFKTKDFFVRICSHISHELCMSVLYRMGENRENSIRFSKCEHNSVCNCIHWTNILNPKWSIYT